MDDQNSLTPRRHSRVLDAPPVQRPNTPVLGSQPISPSTFYGAPKPPPLPSRQHRNPGSQFTAYVAPPEPPSYSSSSFNNSPGFREPELVTEDIMSREDDLVPELVPQHDMQNWSQNTRSTPYDNLAWDPSAPSYGGGGWDTGSTQVADWSGRGNDGPISFDAMDVIGSNKSTTDVAIDGRNYQEEINWWNGEERDRLQRPGPGMLPPVLAEELHNPDHSLFSVNATSPTFAIPGHAQAGSISLTPSSNQHSPSTSSGIAPSFSPPSEEEVRTSVPHPNAYYCPKENGWVILSWKSSSIAPPLARSFTSKFHSLPDQERRKRTVSCIGDAEEPFGPSNKTHHFHKYEKAVDSHKLTIPFRQDDWEAAESVKLKRRAGTVILDDVDFENFMDQEMDQKVEDEQLDEEGRLLDLYVCCQCSFYCVASGVIPGVIPRKNFEEFIRDKKANPTPGKSKEQAVVLAFETFLLAIENKLWKGEHRMIKVSRPNFQSKMGWNANIKRIFDILGFREELLVDGDLGLQPPFTELSTPQGKQNRRRLLRAWVEISAWLVDFQRIHSSHFKDYRTHKLYVQIDSAREMYQAAIGAHPEQIPRGELSQLLSAMQPVRQSWKILGLTPMTYSAELLAFGYLSQCRCDPANTILYFTHFSALVSLLQEYGSCPAQLQELLAMERSRDRFTTEDFAKATATLGFGPDGVLGVEYDDDISDDFIENAWKSAVQRSWRDLEHGSDLHRAANDALRILAEAKGSLPLRKAWMVGKSKYMNPDRAYDTLEIPKDVDDYMLITVFTMRLEEQPMQMEKMREALSVIAEVRDSERLRQFLASGQDPGDIVTPTRPDLPRGLNQLGNTCYLNSLLQYFYTIKDLREAVLPMSKLDLNALDDEKLTDDELKRHRVGGRLVTRREVARSKKFINQLADLFFNLEYCETAAVTPTIELAKLALVTSRDEEEDEADKGGTDSSNDTDATLVDDALTRPPLLENSQLSLSPSRSSATVLGKRSRDIDRRHSEMDVDSPTPGSPDKEIFVTAPSSRTSTSSQLEYPEPSSSKTVPGDSPDTLATPSPQKAPPLPPRKRAEVSDSVMMFGKQHDVAECMDNCMFQIETALLKFDDVNDGQAEGSHKTSVVKRLFYGKIRQRLTGMNDGQNPRPSIHEKEDLFSHLPVNVANDGIDIYDGLSGYFDDVVEFEGRKARMEVSLVDLPPILQIQLQRVQFNRDTLQPYKSQAYVKFGEMLYMDRFMDVADPNKKARSKVIQAELNSCRERVRLLVEGKDGPYTSSLGNTSEFLSKLQGELSLDVDETVLGKLSDEKMLLELEIEQLRSRTNHLKEELENLWRDNTEVAYELTSVFIHRGSSPSWGHYFFYSRHLPDNPESWFKYNDSDVTVVPRDEVLADTTGSTANPYLLVFARKGSDVVDTVNRFDPSSLLESS